MSFDEQLEKIIEAFLDPINLGVFTAIVIVFITGLFFKGAKRAAFPSVLTTIGVFGTFFGIFLGLLEFDVDSIDESIETLLEGLKTAFLSSIEGMFAAIVFRGVLLLSPQGKSATDILSEKIAEANSNSIREALETFIKDLNKGLMDQLGENFKQLNESVGKMVEWLDIHKKFIEKTTVMIENARDALHSSADSLQKIEVATAPLAGNINDLGEVISTVDEQMQTLKNTLAGVSDLGEQAKAVFPALQGGINEMTEHMDTALRQATQNIEQSITTTLGSMDANIDTLAEKLKETTQEIGKSAKQIQNKMDKNFTEFDKKLNDVLTETTQSIEKEATKAVKKVETGMGELGVKLNETTQELAKSAQKTQNKIENNFKIFDEQSTASMQNALHNLGNQLTSISNKLARDYNHLAEAIEKSTPLR